MNMRMYCMYVPAVVTPSEVSEWFSAHHALVDIIVYNPAHPFEESFIRTHLAKACVLVASSYSLSTATIKMQ